jgi:exopolyphosphatase/guanosine-5'-triphosphate,3'-diphosphate pyrophosphatase
VRNFAVIDLGTNTFNLLIAKLSQHDFQVIHTEKNGVALGMGGINKKIITPEAFQRGIKAILEFKNTCQKFNVSEIRAIGTSALRDASNSRDFVFEVTQKTGITIEIISGDEEADLIYEGVLWSHPFNEAGLIMDIGGGSTEFILAEKNGIILKKSFNIGVSRIFQEIKVEDPYSQSNIKEIEDFLEHQTSGFFESFECKTLIGASGSFETFHEMIHKTHFHEQKKSIEFPLNQLHESIEWIIRSTQEERDLHPFIIPIRRKMAPIAAIKTRWVINKLKIDKNYVTPYSLKEGVLRKFKI